MTKPIFPLQPIEIDEHGTPRFVPNKIVQFLLEHGGYDLNKLSGMPGKFSQQDWCQFAQLHGYSVSGWGELSYVDDESYAAATSDEPEARNAALRQKIKECKAGLDIAVEALYGICAGDLEEIGRG